MADKTDIYNMALSLVGDTTIATVEDDVPGVRRLAPWYATIRDELLAQFPWNFAITQATLAQLEAAPAFGFACAYQLPVDCLSVIKLSDTTYEHRIRAGAILETDYDDSETGAEALEIEYVQRVEDESKFSPHFAEVLAIALAMRIVMASKGSQSQRDELKMLYDRALGVAQAADEIQDHKDSEAFDYDTDTWIAARG